MGKKINIKIFDGFEIMMDGKPILENLSNTRKTKLFVAYLLVNSDRPITHQELFELLWSGEDYANPATALRTLLYRFRSMIDKEGADGLAGAIISHRGRWFCMPVRGKVSPKVTDEGANIDSARSRCSFPY